MSGKVKKKFVYSVIEACPNLEKKIWARGLQKV